MESTPTIAKPEHVTKEPPSQTVAALAGILASIGFVLLGLLELRSVAALLATLVTLAGAVLLRLRHRSLASTWGDEAVVAAGGMRLVVISLVILEVFGAFPWVSHLVFGLDAFSAHGRLWPWRGLVGTVGCAAAVTQLSALIDWALIVPRIKGLLGLQHLPCQRDSSWGTWTRLWLGHRVAAFIVVRVALVGVIGFSVVLLIPQSPPHRAGAVTTVSTTTAISATVGTTSTGTEAHRTGTQAATHTSTPNATSRGNPGGSDLFTKIAVPVLAALLVAFLNGFVPIWSFVLNPRLAVGDKIILAEEYGTGVADQPEYYVVDIAAEGVKLLQLENDQAKGSPNIPPEREHDRSLDLVDITRLLRFCGRFEGCNEVCRKVNHNCPIPYGEPIPDPPPQPEREQRPQWWKCFWQPVSNLCTLRRRRAPTQ